MPELPLVHSMPQAAPQPWGAGPQDAAHAARVKGPARAGLAEPAMARLLIHATPAGTDDCARLSRVLRRLRLWATAAARCPRPALSGLRIADRDGRRYFSADELPSVIDLPLPAGVYDISVRHGRQQRRYTLALGQGVAFHLHLRGD